jgi:hypothetical protein
VTLEREGMKPQLNWLRAHLGPLWPYLVLIAIPAAGFIVPDLVGGHLLMTGDNAQQNYPLHVLVGSMLRHGQLPFWNPYIFSGSPLLAGFNAGAFYPLVGLFVILPDRVAWIATEVILFSGIAIGMYVFLRALALSTLACLVAAATFAFSGVVLSQVNHVDLTEGFVALPLMMLSVLHIVRDGRWRWSILLGAGLALVILGGAPEAMLDEALFIIGYAALSAGFSRLSWWRVLTRMGAGAALGLSLAAIQWLPGLEAIANSQRAGFGGGFAATGGFPPNDGLLAVVPYLYGGYHSLGEAGFFSHYNLPEVGTYLGILPIIAVLALLRPSFPSRLSGRTRVTFYFAGIFALLLALGANTPLEHLFNDIPLYGHQRLQSRNMIGVSAAVCVLFAGWLDRTDAPAPRHAAFDRVVGFAPGALVLALAGWALFDPDSLITRLARATPSARSVHTVREATLIALAFTGTAGLIVLSRQRLRVRQWFSLVGVFVVIDLGLMAGTSQLISTPSNAVLSATTPIDQFVAAHLPAGGRFDIYDPQGYSSGASGTTPIPDANVLAKLPSVGGYASIVNADYNAVTETHSGGDLNISSLGDGKLNDLDLQDLVTVPQYFMLPVSGAPSTLTAVKPVSESRGADPNLPLGFQANFDDTAYPFYPAPRAALVAGQSESWFFGESVDPPLATLLFTSAANAAQIRFGIVGTTNVITWGPVVAVDGHALSVSGNLPSVSGVGLAVQVMAGSIPRHQAVFTIAQQSYELDGSLSAVVHPGPWRYQGTSDGYTLMVRTSSPHPVHVAGPGSGQASVLVESSNTKTETVRVHTGVPVQLVRDVAWDNGWRATLSVDGRPPVKTPVSRDDLVQGVRLPAGNDVVTFAYRPPHLLVATSLTLGAIAFLLGLAASTAREQRRRRISRRDEPG